MGDNLGKYESSIMDNKWFRAVSMTTVFLISIILAVYVTSIAPQNFPSAEALAIAEAPTMTEQEETETETETELLTETTTGETTATETTTKIKYKANTKVHTVVASGDKKKDQDKGNDKVMDDSLQDDKPLSEGDKIPEHNDSIPVDPTPQPQPSNKKRTQYYFADPSGATGWKTYGSDLFYFDESTHQPLKGLQKINGKNYYFNNYGAKASLVGIDVSQHNGKLDWNKIKDNGVDYAIIRVGFRGYGIESAYKPVRMDRLVEENIRGAKAAGIPIGLYFYSQAISVEEALEEAGACVNIANKYGVTYPIYFDTEFATNDRHGRADKLSSRDRTNYAVAFCEAVRNAGYTPGVYASKDFFYHNLEFSRLRNYEIWVAHYTSRKGGTDFKYSHEMWQYTEKGSIAGSSKCTDVNISYYDYKNRTNMKQNGKNVIFTDGASVKQYLAAESAFDCYIQSEKIEDYKQAKALISQLPGGNVQNTWSAELEKLKAAVDKKTTEAQTTDSLKPQVSDAVKPQNKNEGEKAKY